MALRGNDYYGLLFAGFHSTTPKTSKDLLAAFDVGEGSNKDVLTLTNWSKCTSRAAPPHPLIAGVNVWKAAVNGYLRVWD